MFGLSKKEVLIKAVKNACANELNIYRNRAKEFVSLQLTDVEMEEKAQAMRREYFDAVFDAIWSSFRASSPSVEAQMRLAMMNPAMTGLPEEFNVDYFCDYGISAGCTFAIAYYALSGKPISTKDYKTCSMLNHFQNNLMQDALIEIDNAQ